MYVWCSRNTLWHCPALFDRNCWRHCYRWTRVIYQTRTHKHARLGPAQFKSNLVGLTMEQLGVQCYCFRGVFVEGEERHSMYCRGEKSLYSSFPFPASLCLTWLLPTRVWQPVIFRMITFWGHLSLCHSCLTDSWRNRYWYDSHTFCLFSPVLCLSIQFFVTFIFSWVILVCLPTLLLISSTLLKSKGLFLHV